MQGIDHEKQFGGRAEYEEQTMRDRLAVCTRLTDTLDDLFDSPYRTHGAQPSRFRIDGNGNRDHSRSFQYLEANTASGQTWPLTEKTIDIHYAKTAGKSGTESYFIAVATRIHLMYTDQLPVLNIYEISYGPQRRTVQATIHEPEIIDTIDKISTHRPMTPYDHTTLMREFGALDHALHTQALEDSHVSNIQHNPAPLLKSSHHVPQAELY